LDRRPRHLWLMRSRNKPRSIHTFGRRLPFCLLFLQSYRRDGCCRNRCLPIRDYVVLLNLSSPEPHQNKSDGEENEQRQTCVAKRALWRKYEKFRDRLPPSTSKGSGAINRQVGSRRIQQTPFSNDRIYTSTQPFSRHA